MLPRFDLSGWWASLGRPLTHLPRAGAIAVLVGLLLALAWSSHATGELARVDHERVAHHSKSRIGDLELYRRIHVRYNAGENYYAAALDEQRHNNYPTSPFFTVRLPMLATLDGWLAGTPWKVISGVLLLGMIFAWVSALSGVAAMPERVFAAILIFISGFAIAEPRALQFHELVAGALLTVALPLYRRSRWWPTLLLAAVALAIRELVVPFLLLWGALAVLDRRWKEAGAIAVVLALFAVAMTFHAQAVAPHRLPDDIASPGWEGFNGPQMALLALGRLTPLLVLPMEVAAPIAILPMLGWIALGGRVGFFASAWFAGFFLFMAIFARTNNFYWVLMVLPAYAAGLAFVPRATAELVKGAIRGPNSGRKSLS